MSMREEQSGLVLLVEDNRGIAEMVGEFLERRGYSVDYAADGVTGLHLAVSNSYDVIVLDLMLPGMDGLEVCRKLRTRSQEVHAGADADRARHAGRQADRSGRRRRRLPGQTIRDRANWKRACVR